MFRDPIVEEVERIKEAQARKYKFNVRAMGEALMREQKKNKGKVTRVSKKKDAG